METKKQGEEVTQDGILEPKSEEEDEEEEEEESERQTPESQESGQSLFTSNCSIAGLVIWNNK